MGNFIVILTSCSSGVLIQPWPSLSKTFRRNTIIINATIIPITHNLEGLSYFLLNVAVSELPVLKCVWCIVFSPSFPHISLLAITTPPHATAKAPVKTYLIATRFEENIFITICLNALGHKPDKLIEADVPVAIDVDHIDQVLQLLLSRRPPKRPHHLRFFQSLKRSTCTVTTCPSSSEPIEPPPSLRKSIFLFWLIAKCEII